MGNETKYGSFTRTAPKKTETVSVRDALDRCYIGVTEPITTRDTFELDAFRRARDHLDEESRGYIERQQKKVSMKYKHAGCALEIKNFSTLGMLELLTKLGIFLNASEGRRQ